MGVGFAVDFVGDIAVRDGLAEVVSPADINLDGLAEFDLFFTGFDGDFKFGLLVFFDSEMVA